MIKALNMGLYMNKFIQQLIKTNTERETHFHRSSGFGIYLA